MSTMPCSCSHKRRARSHLPLCIYSTAPWLALPCNEMTLSCPICCCCKSVWYSWGLHCIASHRITCMCICIHAMPCHAMPVRWQRKSAIRFVVSCPFWMCVCVHGVLCEISSSMRQGSCSGGSRLLSIKDEGQVEWIIRCQPAD